MVTRGRAQTCTDHCKGCGGHFHGVAAFDAHRVGSFSDPADPRRCANPAEVARLQLWTPEGRCTLGGKVAEGVPIFQLAQSDRAREWLAGVHAKRETAA